MNLYIEDIQTYLLNAWDEIILTKGESKEARFIVESLSPKDTFQLFSTLEAHHLQQLQQLNLECHFKVAKGLWDTWIKSEDRDDLIKEMRSKQGVSTSGELSWIDEEDRLTWYRNITKSDEKDGLVVILLGLNHTSDQGGLADFHIVDENRIWEIMGFNFKAWIEKIDQEFDLDANNQEVECFNTALLELFKYRPRQLAKLSEFLQYKVLSNTQDIENLSDIIVQFYKSLPFWEIPSLHFLPEHVCKPRETNGAIRDAANFISHQKLKTPSEQKKSWAKIEKFVLQYDEFELPEVLNTYSPYTDQNEYSQILKTFIEKADANSRLRLLTTDLLPIIKALKTREPSERRSRETNTRLKGMSIDIFLQAIWSTLLDFSKYCHDENIPLVEVASNITIIAEHFSHDLGASLEERIDGEELAKEVLQGCLGGLPDLLSSIHIQLPIDAEQAALSMKKWKREIKVSFDFDPNKITYRTGRARPHLRFQVNIEIINDNHPFSRRFEWAFENTHAERVRFQSAKEIIHKWKKENYLLPAFRLSEEIMTALYFAADEEEANRLINDDLHTLEVVSLISEIDIENFDFDFRTHLRELVGAYYSWLSTYLESGYYQANKAYYSKIQDSYDKFAKSTLDKNKKGSIELLRRLYKAFLLVDASVHENDDYLQSAVVWGLSPPLIELTSSKERFLCDSFPEVIAEFIREDNPKAAKSKQVMQRLLSLVAIKRPLAGLVVDAKREISARIKSFNLIHYLGERPPTEKSLAVQTLLRETDENSEDLSEIRHDSENGKVVIKVLQDYQNLYAFAEDGLRIIAVYIEDLPTILSGVDGFLQRYLKKSSPSLPAFYCNLMVYSTSSSPLAVEKKLAYWRDDMVEKYSENERKLHLSISHRFAPDRETIVDILKQDKGSPYDVAFLFKFLGENMFGETKKAEELYELDFNNLSKFPIGEYPSPIQKEDALRRHTLLSNRQMRIQTSHADLSARLRHPEGTGTEHLIFGHVDYEPWQEVIECLHQKAQWVVCIDPFVDKRLLSTSKNVTQRKIVGFTSGLGDYGELNLSISTEQDTLTQLSSLVSHHLSGLFSFSNDEDLNEMSSRIVEEAEEVIGLSSLRAVVGRGEKIREVIGFAAIHRAISSPPTSTMTQLVPLDAFMHWFTDQDIKLRPDLLQLSLTVRNKNKPLIEATLIECKLAQYSQQHINKAIEQIEQGLSHLTQLFSPYHDDLQRVTFDRRYWWAQLQRAITSRAVVSLSENERKQLDTALEHVIQGNYEISWKSAIFTFWTDIANEETKFHPLTVSQHTIKKPFQLPSGFILNHWGIGYKGLISLFKHQAKNDIAIKGEAITLNSPSKQLNNDAIDPKSISNTRDINPIGTPIFQDLPNENTSETTKQSLSNHRLDEGNSILNTLQPDIELKEKIKKEFVIPEKILIGTKDTNNAPVYWHYGHASLSNRHILIFGSSGSGKTYGIQCLLAEMAQQGLNSLIIDYTDGFLPNQVEKRFAELATPKDHYIYSEQLPLSPFRRQKQIIDPSIPAFEEKSFDVASRVSSIFTSVFNTMGDQQAAILSRVIETGIENSDSFSLDDVLALLKEEGSTGENLANKLEPFIKSRPFQEQAKSSWKQMLESSENKVHVLQLKGFSRDIQKLATEFSLWDLYDFASNTGNKNTPIPLVLDEIQNLDHRSDSPIDKMLREGRKFGLSLMLATQTISNFDREAKDRLFQAGHKLFFKPANTEINSFAEVLSVSSRQGTKQEWAAKLSKLQKGQCYSLGPVLTSNGTLTEKPILVNITSFEKRSFEK